MAGAPASNAGRSPGGSSAGSGVGDGGVSGALPTEQGGTSGLAGMSGTAGMGGTVDVSGAAGMTGTAGMSGTAGTGVTGGMGGNAMGGMAAAGAGAGGASAGMGASGASGAPEACATNQIATCTGTDPIECHFGGSPGDYLVTVDLGGSAAGDTYIEAESFRRMLGDTITTAGQTQRFSFFVNVRQPEGQPIQNVPAGTAGLDLYFHGNAPELSAVCFEAKKSVPKLWIAGDSTVCDQDTIDYSGWGQHLPQFIVPPVSVANYADSGESSGSFLGSSKLWGAIKVGWAAGDYVLIQLGHNDKDVSAATFQSNMTTMVTQAKAAGVNPILLTPTSRVGYALAEEHVNGTGANLPQIIRDLGTSESVPVIDLTVITWNWLETVDWTEYYALGTDHTHTNPKGAEIIAGFVRDAIRAQKLPLSDYLR